MLVKITIILSMILLLLLNNSLKTEAQVKDYTFAQASSSYTPISGGTVLWSGSFDDEVSEAIPIPAFIFDGYQYTGIFVSANGFITFGLPPETFNPISDSGAYKGAVSLLGTDLENAASGSPEVRYRQAGDTFVIQWQDVRRFNVTGERISGQIRLNTVTNNITILYGGVITPGSSTTYFQVGLRGGTNNFSTDVNNRRITATGGSWINSLAGNANTSTMYFNPSNPGTVPSAGLRYRWTVPDFPPAIIYTALGNTTGFDNRALSGVQIVDYGGQVAGGSLSPRIYWRVNGGGWNSASSSSSSSPYDFTIGTTDLSIGDAVEYFIIAQDLNGKIRAVPGNGLTASNVNNVTAFPTNPYSYVVVDLPLSGDYVIGADLFRLLSGSKIYFEKRVRKVNKEVSLSPYHIDPEKYETDAPTMGSSFPDEPQEFRTSRITGKDQITIVSYDEEYYMPMLNGREYTAELYHGFIDRDRMKYELRSGSGAYATIGAALADIKLRGVSGPVRLLLADATYSSETYPLVIGEIPGSSEINNITLLPAEGVTSQITANINQPVMIFDGASDFIIDGRQNGSADPGSLTISNTLNAANAYTVQFLNGSHGNAVQYCSVNNATAGTTGPRAIEFGTSNTGSGNSGNRISNCIITGGRTGIGFTGSLNANNTGNLIENCSIVNFGFSGIWLLSNSENTVIRGCEIYQTTTGVNSGCWGIQLGSVFGVNEVYGNKIYNIQSISTSTIRGISLSPAEGAVCNIYNNFISLTADNGTKLSVYGIQSSGGVNYELNIYYNSIRIGGVHTGGSVGTIITGGFVKGNSGAGSIVNYKNNIILNTRTGGNSSAFHLGGYFANASGTNEIDYNAYWASGTPNSYSSGWGLGIFYTNIIDYKTAALADEQHSVFAEVNFVSNTDLHLTGSSIGDHDLEGIYLISIPDDIDGHTRHNPPYMGADERTDHPLPVELASFTATADKRDVYLYWATAGEMNNSGFEIFRRVYPGKAGTNGENGNWVNIGFVRGSGTTGEVQNYSFTDRALSTGKYNYRLKQVDYNGNYEYFNLENVVEVGIPGEISLSQNYPNPFNPVTKIDFDLPFDSKVTMKVFDITGREVAVLVNDYRPAGYYTVSFNGMNFSSGVYFCRFAAGGTGGEFSRVMKMTLIK